MGKPRIRETDEGIQGEFDVRVYDRMARRLRDKGWMETDSIIKAEITSGMTLEVGPGPGYLGLEWLKKTGGTSLKGVEISPEMIKIAERNAREYGFAGRVEYVQGDARKIPFEESTFDAVISNGSLHEWAEPVAIFNEVHRVLKAGGRYFISDLKRDMNVLLKWFMWLMTKPKEIRPGLISSINAAYTLPEIRDLLAQSKLRNASVGKNPVGIDITGKKE